jgi:hypothetical protein
MGALIVPDVNDDLSDLTLTQARHMAALDEMPVLPSGPPRIVIVVDATISAGEFLPSREISLEQARASVRPMFDAAPSLQVQVVYFRGAEECQASRWFDNPEEVAKTIAGIRHEPGWTQHGKAFRHIMREAGKRPIHAAVIFTDAVELRSRGNPNGDVRDDLCKDAMRLRRLGCRISFAFKGVIPGGCPIDRAGPRAVERVKELAADNEGCVLNVTDPTFADKLRAVATEATLRAKGDDLAHTLLPDLRMVPFDLTAVGEAVPVGRCTSADSTDSLDDAP